MQAIRLHIILFFAVAIFVAKPFIGFGISQLIANDTEATILIKSFTKRKQEFVDGSEFDVMAIQKKLADPVPYIYLSLFFFLAKFFRQVLSQGKIITRKAVSDIRFQLCPADHLYLLTGKLII